jgi:hypothetical protein
MIARIVVVAAAVLAIVGCGREQQEFYFVERVQGRTIGPFVDAASCEATRTALVDSPRATTPCWRGR